MRRHCRARIFEKRSLKKVMLSDVTDPAQPHAGGYPPSHGHRGTSTSKSPKVLVTRVSENGTMRFSIKSCVRNQSVRYLPVAFHYVTIYGNIICGNGPIYGKNKLSGDPLLGVVFDEESHGYLRFCSFGRRYIVLKQTPRACWGVAPQLYSYGLW